MPNELSGVDKILFDEVREARNDIKDLSKRVTRMEARSGLLGIVGGALAFALIKVKTFFTGGP